MFRWDLMHNNIFRVESFNMIWSFGRLTNKITTEIVFDVFDPVCVLFDQDPFRWQSNNFIDEQQKITALRRGKHQEKTENDGIKFTKTADECKKYINGKRFIVSHTGVCDTHILLYAVWVNITIAGSCYNTCAAIKAYIILVKWLI